jgi:hypothetical protein
MARTSAGEEPGWVGATVHTTHTHLETLVFPYSAHPAGALTLAAMVRDDQVPEWQARNLARAAKQARHGEARASARTAPRPVAGESRRFLARLVRHGGSVHAAGL